MSDGVVTVNFSFGVSKDEDVLKNIRLPITSLSGAENEIRDAIHKRVDLIFDEFIKQE